MSSTIIYPSETDLVRLVKEIFEPRMKNLLQQKIVKFCDEVVAQCSLEVATYIDHAAAKGINLEIVIRIKDE